ncbi:protein phosphatase 2C domain-containing protein [Candidatus Saccharibacteria bacterium]|nr:protein phosphatase 2C domain-containing protein [Candidatus Saccharibacteria bacterium]
MGLFRRNKNNNIETQQWPNPVAEQWQANTQVHFAGERQRQAEVGPAEILPDARQQRKIIAALLNDGINTLIDESNEPGKTKHDIAIGDGDREKLYDMIASGGIDINAEREFLKGIAGPKNKYSAGEVMEGIHLLKDGTWCSIPGIGQDKHMRRMIAAFIGIDPKKPENIAAEHLGRFWQIYETPVDFEEDSQRFLKSIEKHNPPQTYAEYIRSMRQFKHVMFGKQQQYWEQMQLINKEAKNGREMVGEREHVIKAVGSAEVSKAQVLQGLNSEHLEDDGTSQDTALKMPEQGIFGVFDGVGGAANGRLASSTAAAEVRRLGETSEVRNSLDLCGMLDSASRAINNAMATDEEKGASTGTLIKIAETDGHKTLMWASVGDSRLYVVSGRNQVRQVTKDEIRDDGRTITNALGGGLPGERARQAGTVILNSGDRVVLCTDGITGDEGADIMSAGELSAVVSRVPTAEQAAEDLVRQARKRDDRTAIVIQV